MTKIAVHESQPVQTGDKLMLHRFGIGTVTQVRREENEIVVHVKTPSGEQLYLSMRAAAKRVVT